jgi:hypothetical protein
MVGDYYLTEFKFFETFAQSGGIKTMSANEFVKTIVDGVVNPYMKGMGSLANFADSNAVTRMTPEVSIDGYISPWTPSSFDDITFHDLMSNCLDVPVWNEMYTEDRKDGIFLVVRPMPMKNIKGKFIQGKAEQVTVDSDSIIAQNVSRSDSGVANFYWVTNSRWSIFSNKDQTDLARAGDMDSFMTTKYLNSSMSYFGIRKMAAESALGPPDYTNTDEATKEQVPQQAMSIQDWLVARRTLLAELNKDNVIYESGTLRLRGNESIKAGMYVGVKRGTGNTYLGEVYAHTVSHDFVPYQGFFTTVEFDRGTLFAERAQQKTPRYIDEIESQGVR